MHKSTKFLVTTAVTLGLVSGSMGAARAAEVVPVPAGFTITGSGFGHGVGMSQYGAQGMGLDGYNASQILTHYYQGTAVNAVALPATNIRVGILQDKTFIETVLRKDIADNGVISTWTEVIVPLLFLVGNEWEEDGSGIEVEHMLSELLKRIMREGVPEIKNPKNAQPILLAAVGEEMHCLALHALAAALAEKHIESFFLGARTPLEAIDAMVRRSAPPAIFLWAQLSQNSDAKFFRDIPSIRPAPRVIVGGPGWDLDICTDVIVAQDLTHACAEIEGALGL